MVVYAYNPRFIECFVGCPEKEESKDAVDELQG